MKNIVRSLMLLLFCSFISSNAYALSGITTGGQYACLKKQWLDDIITFAVADDRKSVQAYLNARRCFVVKKGLKVTVTESPGVFGTITGFVFEGTKLWTVREGLTYQQ